MQQRHEPFQIQPTKLKTIEPVNKGDKGQLP